MTTSGRFVAALLGVSAGLWAAPARAADGPDLGTIFFGSVYAAAFIGDLGLVGNDIAKAARAEWLAPDYGVAELSVGIPQATAFHALLVGTLGIEHDNELSPALHLPASLSTMVLTHGAFYADAETPYAGAPGKPMVVAYLVGSAVPGIVGGIGYAAHGVPSAKWFATTQLLVNFPALLVGAYEVATQRDDAVEYGAVMSLNALSFLHGAASIIADTILDLDGPPPGDEGGDDEDVPTPARLFFAPASLGERGAPGAVVAGTF